VPPQQRHDARGTGSLTYRFSLIVCDMGLPLNGLNVLNQLRIHLRRAERSTCLAAREWLLFRICHGNPANPVPKSSLSVRAVEAIDWALARSSALFFGVEKPWPVPL
jgi:hypothetical protein